MSDENTTSQEVSSSTPSSSAPFKSAQEPVVVSTTQPTEVQPLESVVMPITPRTSNPSLQEYTADNNQPYANEYFETGTPFDYLPAEVQDQLRDIDRFVDAEIAEKHWKNNLSNYNRVIQELQFEMGLEGSPSELIETLAGYARNMMKINGIDDIRDSIKKQLRKLRRQKDMDAVVLKAIGRKII